MKAWLQWIFVTAALSVAVVAALRGVVLLSGDADGDQARAEHFLQAVSTELDRWYQQSGRYPSDLNALDTAGAERDQLGVSELYGGVLRAPLTDLGAAVQNVRDGRLLDPWGSPWRYELADEGHAVRLRSYGPDRATGADASDDDIELTKRRRATAFSHHGDKPLW
jgi:hypothetical protein